MGSRSIEESEAEASIGLHSTLHNFDAEWCSWPPNECIRHQSIDVAALDFGVMPRCDMDKAVFGFAINSSQLPNLPPISSDECICCLIDCPPWQGDPLTSGERLRRGRRQRRNVRPREDEGRGSWN